MTTIVPVGVVQVGCTVTEPEGVTTVGSGFTVRLMEVEIQPVVVLFTVTL